MKSGPLFTKRTDVLPQDLVKSRSSADSGLDFSNRFAIRQAPRHQCCRDTCRISEWYDHYTIHSRSFQLSRDLAVRRLTTYWLEDQVLHMWCFGNCNLNTSSAFATMRMDINKICLSNSSAITYNKYGPVLMEFHFLHDMHIHVCLTKVIFEE